MNPAYLQYDRTAQQRLLRFLGLQLRRVDRSLELITTHGLYQHPAWTQAEKIEYDRVVKLSIGEILGVLHVS